MKNNSAPQNVENFKLIRTETENEIAIEFYRKATFLNQIIKEHGKNRNGTVTKFQYSLRNAGYLKNERVKIKTKKGYQFQNGSILMLDFLFDYFNNWKIELDKQDKKRFRSFFEDSEIRDFICTFTQEIQKIIEINEFLLPKTTIEFIRAIVQFDDDYLYRHVFSKELSKKHFILREKIKSFKGNDIDAWRSLCDITKEINDKMYEGNVPQYKIRYNEYDEMSSDSIERAIAKFQKD